MGGITIPVRSGKYELRCAACDHALVIAIHAPLRGAVNTAWHSNIDTSGLRALLPSTEYFHSEALNERFMRYS